MDVHLTDATFWSLECEVKSPFTLGVNVIAAMRQWYCSDKMAKIINKQECIPHSSGMRTARLLTGRGGCLSWAVVCPGWTVCQGGCLPEGVSAQGGGGVSSWGSVQGGLPHPPSGPEADTPLSPWTGRHLWKHNLRKLHLWAVIKRVTPKMGWNPIWSDMVQPLKLTLQINLWRLV